MNPRDWRDAVQRLQGLLEPNCHNMENVSRSNREWDTHREYPRYTVPESHRSNVGWKELSPSSHHTYSKVPEMEDPDGEPLEERDEDAELARKKKKLREIEERIMHKKASIAMKGVYVESSTPPGVSGNEQLATREGETLRDRVKEILRQRQHLSYLSKVQLTRERKKSSSLSKDGVLQEQHPLKLRVQALMRRRHSVLPFNSKEVPDVPRSPPRRSVTSPAKREDIINKGFECFLSVLNKGVDISLLKPEEDFCEVPERSLPPPGRSISSPAKEENKISKGFERFLNILNKGVDIEMLSRIMSNDREDIPLVEEPLSIQVPDMESKSDPSFRSERQWTNREVSLLGLSQASRSLHTMDNDAEPDLSRTKESQQLSSGTTLLGLSPASENQYSNSKPSILSLSRASERFSSGASRPVLGKASDSETLPGCSPPSENQCSDTTPIQVSLGREEESKRPKSGALLTGLSQASKNQQSHSRTSLKGLRQASQSQGLKSGTFIPGLGETSDSGSPLGEGHSRTKIAETKINSPIQERPSSKRLSLPDDQEKKKDREGRSLGSSSRSKSPMAVKKKKKEEEKEETPSVNEQHEQLQNILKTLGWNLDVEELSKLANRTQERLYGKKNEDAGRREEHESQPKRSHDRDRRKSSSSRSPLRSDKADRSQERMCGRKSEGRRRRAESRGEEESRQRCSLRDHRKSSSSSSSSRSTSSPSPSPQRRSRSRDLKQRRKVERHRSGERSRERLKHRDGRTSTEAQRDRKDVKHFVASPYPQNQMFPHPAASAFPDYDVSQYSHFAFGHSGHYSGATNPYWTYNQHNIPPSVSASGHPYPHFFGSAAAPNVVYADPSLFTGSASFPDPNLSVSEGQVGSSSRSRCLTVINTEQASSQDLSGGYDWTLGCKEHMGDSRNPKNTLEIHNNTPKSSMAPQESKVCTKTVNDNRNAKKLEKEKPQPTEEEIKANLRKKLEAFNQKTKNTSQLPCSKVMQPANSLISEME